MPRRRFTVVWTPNAESQLAEIWVDADDAEDAHRIASAADHLDEALGGKPTMCGRPSRRMVALRIYEHAPLRVYFSISDPDRKVTVLWVEKTPLAGPP